MASARYRLRVISDTPALLLVAQGGGAGVGALVDVDASAAYALCAKATVLPGVVSLGRNVRVR
jgi:hypothetical protein